MSRISALLRLPLHLLALATQAKSFEGNPIIGNRLLNGLGLHVLRVVLAHTAMWIRRTLIAWRLPAAERQQFQRDGFLIKENFLNAESFAELEREARRMLDNETPSDATHGDTLTRQYLLDELKLNRYPIFAEVTDGSEYQAKLGYVAGRMRVPFRWLQTIHSDACPSAPPDPQRTLHSDTFQPNMKAWLFISHADQRNGAFTYVPGSHQLSLARLRWEYRQSRIGAQLPTQYAARGSLRIEASELAALGLPAARALACPPNTLIVADTRGFHCRGPASEANAQRIELWALSRSNPFNPLPGLPFKALDRLERSIYPRFEQLRLYIRQRRERLRQ